MRSLFLIGALLIAAVPVSAAPVGTAFSYQGQLLKGGSPYQGNANGIFRLYDAATGGSQVGVTVTITSFPVTSGLFTVDLDFGSVFSSTALWLDIQVLTPPDASHTQLTPRVRLSATPFALSAPGGTSQWVNDPFGIHFTSGHVGLGVPGQDSHGGVKLYVNTGTNSESPLWVLNNNASFSSLYTANTAPNGLGWFDDQSDRHYIVGRFGVNIQTPACNIHSLGVEAVRGVSNGGGGTGLTPAGIHGMGGGSVVLGWSPGIVGEATGNNGVVGYTDDAASYGGYFRNRVGGSALFADGVAKVRTLQILGGADLAEPFDVAKVAQAEPEPGSVVVIDPARPGELRVSEAAYDTRVAGVISGARGLAPGMILKAEGEEHADGDYPVALTGRVWCKVDASFGAVRPGDLLTTSATPGHAMNAVDPGRRPGAVIGKAMTSLEAGRGLVLVLVSLQ